MTPLYILLGKPGNIEEAAEKAKSKGNRIDIIPGVRVYENPDGSFLDASYYIKLQLVNGGWSDSHKRYCELLRVSLCAQPVASGV